MNIGPEPPPTWEALLVRVEQALAAEDAQAAHAAVQDLLALGLARVPVDLATAGRVSRALTRAQTLFAAAERALHQWNVTRHAQGAYRALPPGSP